MYLCWNLSPFPML